ncbi:aldehyde dehydrogenase [Kineosporia babensis]|uniref:Aldehyde dehydrogenase n=1 Tax=Kineosporia babensis TaxID=499548 RepID=A0A9X1SSY9_9ACTN|nr:aldehyde dehydrogenase [Kineosporia babensis]MCD5311139.1 aldehyde dehydrogenase [Kineosporia babensis]
MELLPSEDTTSELLHYERLFIGGRWTLPSSDATITVIAAGTGEIAGRVPEAVEADIDAAVSAARQAFDDPAGWSTWNPARRAEALESLVRELQSRGPAMIERLALQNGMPVTIGQAETEFPLAVLRHSIDLARNTPAEQQQPHTFGGTSTVRRRPLGVVAAITPWNFPQILASFKYAAALAAGCTVVLKPSPESVLDAMLLAEAVEASDIPDGVFNVVPGGREAGAHLVVHPDVDKVAFTGSTPAGRQIAETAGRLLRPVTLELGGKSAAIILEDADLDLSRIADDLYAATLMNSGQTCYIATRILAPRSRYEEVVDTFARFVSSLKVGDPRDPATQVGPVITETHRERVESFIAKGISEGARLVAGGGRPAGRDRGWFLEPTLFADVDNRSALAQEEVFGPVLTITPYTDVEDAIRLANESDYGLGGSVWTQNLELGMEVARRVRTGTIGVNRYFVDPGAPFGGVKSSGLGRELGPDALQPYQELQTIYS